MFKKISLGLVLLAVSGAAEAKPFIVKTNGTVADRKTGLIWQQNDDGKEYVWEAALRYCEELSFAGQNDWRLPNYKELTSLVEYGNFSPAIFITYFPKTKSANYWSSTTDVSGKSGAWQVNFQSGFVDSYFKHLGSFVRCVHGG